MKIISFEISGWRWNPDERPTFKEIHVELESMTTVGFNTQENGNYHSAIDSSKMIDPFYLGTPKILSTNDYPANGNRARTGPSLPPPRPPARTCSFSSVTSPAPPPPPPAAAHQSLLARLLPSPRPKVPIDQQQTTIVEDPSEQTLPTIIQQQPLRDRPRHVNPEARLSTFSKKQTPLPLASTLPNSLSTTTFVGHNHSSTSNGIEPLQNVVCDSTQRPTPPLKPNRDGSIKFKSNKKSLK
jgi:hypothetical protein